MADDTTHSGGGASDDALEGVIPEIQGDGTQSISDVPETPPKKRRRRRKKPVLSSGAVPPMVADVDFALQQSSEEEVVPPAAPLPPLPEDPFAQAYQDYEFSPPAPEAVPPAPEPVAPMAEPMPPMVEPVAPAPSVYYNYDPYTAHIPDPFAEPIPLGAYDQKPAPAPVPDPVVDDPFSIPLYEPEPVSPFKEEPPPIFEAAPMAPPEPEVEAMEQSESLDSDGPIEGELVQSSSSGGSAEAPMEDFELKGSVRDRLEDLLREANLTPRHVKFCCTGLLAVILLVAAGWWFVPRWLNRAPAPDSDPIVEEEEPVVDEEKPSAEVPADEGEVMIAWVDSSVYAALLTGDPSLPVQGDSGPSSAVKVATSTAQVFADQTRLQFFIEDLEDLYHLYKVDVVSLLDASPQRTEALDEHLEILVTRYDAAVTFYEEAIVIKGRFSEDFNTHQPGEDAIELAFFDQIRDFNSVGAQQALNEFIALSQAQVDRRAWYYAFSKVQTLYERLLPPLKSRITDIQLNRSALISGVQVVDVLNSDLDLILSEKELED